MNRIRKIAVFVGSLRAELINRRPDQDDSPPEQARRRKPAGVDCHLTHQPAAAEA